MLLAKPNRRCSKTETRKDMAIGRGEKEKVTNKRLQKKLQAFKLPF